MTEAHPEGAPIYTIQQEESPCVLHDTHRPVTIINELHHVFPQAWQIKVWGEVRDQTRWSICSTSHNSVHEALRIHDSTGEWPHWCIGKTRDCAEEAINRRAAAQGGWDGESDYSA